MTQKIQIRRDTTSQWNNQDPILNPGEFGFDLTSKQLKIGDGITTWNNTNNIIQDGDRHYKTLDLGSNEVKITLNASNGQVSATKFVGDGSELTNIPAPSIPNTYLKTDDNISRLTNDASYITAAALPSVPTKTSDLTNDGADGSNAFITSGGAPVQSVNGQTGIVNISVPDTSSFLQKTGGTMSGDLFSSGRKFSTGVSGQKEFALSSSAIYAYYAGASFDNVGFKVTAGGGQAYGSIRGDGTFLVERSTGGQVGAKFRLESGNSSTTSPDHRTTQLDTVDGLRLYRYSGDSGIYSIKVDNSAGVRAYVKSNGSASFVGVRMMSADPDDPTNYETDSEFAARKAALLAEHPNINLDEVTREYTGPFIDIKERILNFQNRLAAVEANEIVDDATDNALLQLVASLSQRLDTRDDQIADLTTRLQALEAGGN